MLEKTYTRAALAVLPEDFNEYLSQFNNGVVDYPAVLHRCFMREYKQGKATVIILTWEVDWGFASDIIGVSGDDALLEWFSSRPHRFLVVGRDMIHWESVKGVNRENVLAFLNCFSGACHIKISPDASEKRLVMEYLYEI